MIDVFEYMRLADDGCPNTPADVPNRPDGRFEWADEGFVLMNVPISYQDFAFSVQSTHFMLRHAGGIDRGT